MTAAVESKTTGELAGKPKLRGVFHAAAVLPALLAALWIVQCTERVDLQLPMIFYGATLVMLFAVSGFYHCPNWPEETRLHLRRFDRSMIYLFLAGSFTPYFTLIESPWSPWVLTIVWTGSLSGATKSILFPKAPRALTAGLYVVLGLTAAPFFPEMAKSLGSTTAFLILAGGIAHLSGAVCYARRGPNPIPGVFGYHEIFHLLVVLGVALHHAGLMLNVS